MRLPLLSKTSSVGVSKSDSPPSWRSGGQRPRGASRQPVDSQARSAAALVGEQAPAPDLARPSDRPGKPGTLLCRAP